MIIFEPHKASYTGLVLTLTSIHLFNVHYIKENPGVACVDIDKPSMLLL